MPTTLKQTFMFYYSKILNEYMQNLFCHTHITFRMHQQHIFRTWHFLTTKQCQFPVCTEKNSHNPQRKNRMRIPSEKDASLLKRGLLFEKQSSFSVQLHQLENQPFAKTNVFTNVIQRITQNHKIRNTKSGKLSSTSRTQRIITFFGPF
jgi:hypothetical protein